jgi:AbrB family looped-hinge helix DNA binding protein
MLATLTSKGQITLPKEIRDRLGLDTGAVLDFELLPDNTIRARAVKPDARRIRGLLKSPHSKPLTVEQMDEGIARSLRARHAPPAQRRRKASAA